MVPGPHGGLDRGVRVVITPNAFGENMAHKDNDWAIAPRRQIQQDTVFRKGTEKTQNRDAAHSD